MKIAFIDNNCLLLVLTENIAHKIEETRNKIYARTNIPILRARRIAPKIPLALAIEVKIELFMNILSFRILYPINSLEEIKGPNNLYHELLHHISYLY